MSLGIMGAWGLPGGGGCNRTELRRMNSKVCQEVGRAFQVEVNCTQQAQRNDTAGCVRLA